MHSYAWQYNDTPIYVVYIQEQTLYICEYIHTKNDITFGSVTDFYQSRISNYGCLEVFEFNYWAIYLHCMHCSLSDPPPPPIQPLRIWLYLYMDTQLAVFWCVYELSCHHHCTGSVNDLLILVPIIYFTLNYSMSS